MRYSFGRHKEQGMRAGVTFELAADTQTVIYLGKGTRVLGAITVVSEP